MFEGLTGRLGDIFDKLRRRGALTEEDVSAAMREVRVALLEADVALPVVKQFVAQVKERAVGQEVLRSISPGQQVIKIVHDNLVEMLGEGVEINLNAAAPVPILMVGLQGSGKTTSTAKIALRLKTKERKKVLMASLDVRRPAAQEQLKVLGEQVGVATLPIVPGQDPIAIAKRALETGRLEGYDVVMLDTAGRLSIDEELMAEVAAVRDATKPAETLLVADAMTGQDAVTVATNFNDKVGITGIMLTRIDGDARGGAALSMRQITGKPIKLLGTGEKIDELEPFHPDRIAGRILGMGDVVSLVEKAVETIDKEDAEKLARKMEKGGFDLDDMAMQMKQLRKMGGMSGLMGMLPGIGKIKDQMKDANIDDGMIKRQEAIISSMTKAERKTPDIIKASRRKRIAAGSGTSVQEVNKLLKQFETMRGMMKQVQKLGKKGLMRQGLQGLLPKNFRSPF
ncbi:signal recognition particle protein [Azospirillum doebereinerae]|uniref:Signal recognition particle protein n=1 Tax=Azospirillum doebereinerae TaxID=92933 RepID=A0A433JDY3_9PROT|nr:signal recognition particle protein [Azospirillum doebereinerae]MCG5239234.1 signal recognition particle protein [Azospirillum doebereinerae]RUQ75110.1 signal recognition particle protein [Azospirillum doebereinerae]